MKIVALCLTAVINSAGAVQGVVPKKDTWTALSLTALCISIFEDSDLKRSSNVCWSLVKVHGSVCTRRVRTVLNVNGISRHGTEQSIFQ